MGRSPSYSLERIEEGLTALVFSAGNASEASRRTDVPRQTLDGWKLRYADRYEKLRDKYGHEIEERVVRDARDLAAEISQAERLAVQRVRERLEQNEDNQPATTLQRLSTSKGINIDKTLLLEGRPTQHVQHHSADEIIRTLGQHIRKTGASTPAIEGTATEVG